MRGRLASAWRKLEAGHDALFTARWRQGLRGQARREQDTLRALVLLDSLGVDNPVAYETLDVIPYLVADVHEWHRRMGRESFGDPGVCC
ncbi:cory-CC-star protein [Saccharomonospora saliphila]|uniref:cory-CC-star protein n=1 Tax=Saccharomonospora saliphila TaxID=369829 RepID=UPI0003A62355|nr:cory-CC-star protein [Saccharomonospora saliphila]